MKQAQPDLSRAIVSQALSFGATHAGVASFASVRGRPEADRLDSVWPRGAAAVVVVSLSHPSSAPELDDWGVELGTEGNRRLAEVLQRLERWLRETHHVASRPLPYQVEPTGVLLKDAAALAGLGVIGANNLLVTPSVGPRVRLRALALDSPVASTPSSAFQPCDGCARPCHAACPRTAFVGGRYVRERCARQMAIDESRRTLRVVDGSSGPQARAMIRYCRICELACPVGRSP